MQTDAGQMAEEVSDLLDVCDEFRKGRKRLLKLLCPPGLRIG